ncbi:MAG: glutamine amidotransferase [Desulfobacter sp.]
MTTPETLFVIKAGSTFPDMAEALGDFDAWIINGLDPDRSHPVKVVRVDSGEQLPEPRLVKGAVISGAHAMVTDGPDWSLALEHWTKALVSSRIPVLGICYGHQTLARAMGGLVEFHPRGIEIGTTDISCLPEASRDILFRGLPETFKGHVVHSQSVTRLPENAVLLAGNRFEPHHGFRIGPCAWGVQFHPEFSMDATLGYIRHMFDAIEESGQDSRVLIDNLEETPHASSLLRRFGEIVRSS